MRGQNAFVFNLNMIIHIFLHLSNAFSPGLAGRWGRGEVFSRFWMPAAGGCVPFCRRTRAGIWCFFPKTAGGRAAKRCIRPNFGIEAAGKPCPTGCGTALPSGKPGRPAPRDGRNGGGSGQKLRPGQELPISIHAPREGSDSTARESHRRYKPFLSTLPVRGATTKSNKHQRWISRKSPK